MIRKLQEYVNLGTRFYGLDISNVEGRDLYFLLKVNKKKGELQLEESKRFENLTDTLKDLDTAIPFFITLNTKSVLTKIAQGSNQKGRALANSVFPNMDTDSLYYESYGIWDSTLISIARKSEIDNHIKALKEAGFSVGGISLGLSALTPLAPYLEGKVSIHSQSLVPGEKTIELISDSLPDQNGYAINGLDLDRGSLLGFGSILRGFLTNSEANTNLDGTMLREKNEFKNRRNFKLSLNFGIGLLLAVLLINFVFFGHYHSKVITLREEMTLNESAIDRLKKLKGKVAEKDVRVKKALSTSGSQVTRYLDQIADVVPNSVLLDELIYQPLDKPIRPSKPIAYVRNSISVSGLTSNNLEFTNWIGKLERMEWTQSVETMEYDYKDPTSSVFHLQIRLRDER